MRTCFLQCQTIIYQSTWDFPLPSDDNICKFYDSYEYGKMLTKNILYAFFNIKNKYALLISTLGHKILTQHCVNVQG